MVVNNKNGLASHYADKKYSSNFFNATVQRWLVEIGVPSQTAMYLAKCINEDIMKKCKTRKEFFSMFYTFLKLMTTDEGYCNDVLKRIALTTDSAIINSNKYTLSNSSNYKEVVQQFIGIFCNISCGNTDSVTMKDLCSELKIVLFKIVKYVLTHQDTSREPYLKWVNWRGPFLEWYEYQLQKIQGTYNSGDYEFERTHNLGAIVMDLYVLHLLMDSCRSESTTNFNGFLRRLGAYYTDSIITYNLTAYERTNIFCEIAKETINEELGYQTIDT